MRLKFGVKFLLVMLCTLLAAGAAGANPLPLSKVPVPEPPNLSDFVKDKAAAIRLGKAFFWDMQVGSDGVQACASCHFNAGADSRLRNQLNPGPAVPPSAAPSFETGSGLNYLLQATDFPFVQVSPVDGRLGIDPVTGLPLDPNTVMVRNVNDIAGSQGLPLADFLAVNAGTALDSGSFKQSPVFASSRQVTGRNAPSVINAVFNYANFWDGRANNIFNGENPLGPLDTAAGIWLDDGTSPALIKQKVAIPNASLASQATGPPLSSVEMSFAGRSFPEVGRKLLSLTPLGGQLVHPGDGVLGPFSKATLQPDGSVTGSKGLSGSYQQMIRDAFQDRLWSSSKTVTLSAGPSETDPRFSQMEANFPLFWGLALQLYQATLVSDRSPFDRFLAGNADVLSASAQNGFTIFVSKCIVCHTGSETTSAAVGTNSPFCAPPDCNPRVFKNNSSHFLVRADADPVTFAVRLADTGFFNIGVRPTAEDLGRGGGAAEGFPFPLSFTRLAQQQGLPFVTPALPQGLSVSMPTAVDGAFKTPGLRNVELTAPYMHNGGMLTLEEVVEFYTRGGNFPGNPELAGAMQPIRNLRGSAAKRADLVAFLKSLTDERVRNETAPFDHPELLIPSGDPADTMIRLAPTGGSPVATAPGLTVNPVDTPTVLTSLTFSGTVAPLSTVEAQVNQLPAAFATVTGNTWTLTLNALPTGTSTVVFTATSDSGGVESRQLTITVLPVAVISGAPAGGRTTSTSATLSVGGSGIVSYRYRLDAAPFSADTPVATPIVLSGLSDGVHTVTVLGKDAAGNEQPLASATSASWTVKSLPPLLTVAPIAPVRVNSQTIGGTVELGSIPQVVAQSPAQAGPVQVIGGAGVASWSCTISGLVEGVNNVTVTAVDFVFNVSTVKTVVVLDTVAPSLTLDPPPALVRSDALTLTGTVEAGVVPQIAAGAALAGPVQVAGGNWSSQLSGLAPGANSVSITATDAAGNVSTVSAAIARVIADGSFKGTVPDISDALTALRIAVGLVQPTTADLLHGDVAPLVNGLPAPDGQIDIVDALTILRKVVGLVNF